MTYEEIQKQRARYKHDPKVIDLTYQRNQAVREGNFRTAFALQEALENIWFNMLKEKEEQQS